MSEDRLTLRAALDRLAGAGLLEAGTGAAVGKYLAERDRHQPEPLYIRGLLGFGAWAAAAIFFGFLALGDVIPDTKEGLMVSGIILIAGASLLRRFTRGVFLNQLALVLGITGNIAILAGVDRGHYGHGELAAFALAQTLVCIAAYPGFPDAIYRFLSPLTAIGLIVAAILEGHGARGAPILLQLLIGLEIAATGVLFFWPREIEALRPLRYAFAVSLPATILLITLMAIDPRDFLPVLTSGLWGVRAVMTAGLALLIVRLGGVGRLKSEWMIVALAGTVVFGVFTSPGVLAALGLLALGFALADRFLLGLGFVFLPAFLALFYYALDVSLAYKSWTLAGTGAVLLAARWWLGRRPWARGETP